MIDELRSSENSLCSFSFLSELIFLDYFLLFLRRVMII